MLNTIEPIDNASQNDYIKMVSLYNDLVESYNHQEKVIEKKDETISDITDTYRSRLESEQEIVRNMHGIVKEMRNELSSQFRKKNIHTINWFNEILKKYYSLGGYIDPIRADEMYSAKAVITFDGNYRHPDRSIDSIKTAIIDAIESTRGFSDKVSIQQILIEDVYDVEELSDSKEG